MPKAKYVGDPNDNFSGPEVIEVGGHAYTKDKSVTVEDAVAKRLATNNHFEVTGLKKGSDAPIAADDGVESIVHSTTGDPETTSRESMVSQDSDDATDPMQEPS